METNNKCMSLCEWVEQNKFYALLLVVGGAAAMYYLYENEPKHVTIYFCDECDREFKTKRTFMRHYNAKHNGANGNGD